MNLVVLVLLLFKHKVQGYVLNNNAILLFVQYYCTKVIISHGLGFLEWIIVLLKL